MPTNTVQRMGRQRQALAASFQGTQKRNEGDWNVGILATSNQNSPVKGGVVGNKTGCPLPKGGHPGPGFSKCWGILEHAPSQPMNMGKTNAWRWRPQQGVVNGNNGPGLYSGHANGTGGIGCKTRCFKIYGNDRGRATLCRSPIPPARPCLPLHPNVGQCRLAWRDHGCRD